MVNPCETLPLGLVATQAAFFARVTRGEPKHDSGNEAAAELLPLRPERVAVYQNGYRARLVECLADDYPAVCHLLGELHFEQLCHGYLGAHPPGPSLNDFGANFAQYLAARGDEQDAFAAELAQLEWALVRAVHASDVQQLSPDRLAALTPEAWQTARLVPSRTLTLLGTRFPVNAYLQTFREGGSPEIPGRPSPSWVVVCRRGFDVWRLDLGDEMGRLMAALVDGRPLAAALDVLTPPSTEAETAARESRLQQAFQQWVSAGCFADIAHDHASGS